jgi:hypothetical protein
MENRSQKLLKSLKDYYSDQEKLQQITHIIHKNTDEDASCVSLRLIEWLVINYSKSRDIIYSLDDDEFFNIHQSYKNMLKSYSKKMFDTFRRHERVYLECPYVPGGTLETTVAQLTFFKWAIDNKVLDYAIKHKSEIKEHMDKNTEHRKNKTTKTKRKELSKNDKSAKLYQLNIRVTFS